MVLKNKVIVIISPDSWEFVSVSKHHYARELAKNNKVYFINTPNSGEDTAAENVHVLNKYKRIRGISKIRPKFLKRLCMKIEINSILKTTGKIDVVWSFDTSRLYFLELFHAKHRIAHLVDYTESFHLKELLQSSTIALATSDSIIANITPFQSNVLKVNHGFKNGSINEDIMLPGDSKIKGIYIGNLSISYLDWKVATEVAKNNSAIDFIFIGPILEELNADRDVTFSLDNVYSLPAIESKMVYAYLKLASFSLVLYKADQYYNQLQNPHKIMQYLGAGLPIFSSLTHEYRDLDLLCMYQNKDNVLDDFKHFLAEDSSHFTSESQQKRVDFALSNSYEKQLIKIEKLLAK